MGSVTSGDPRRVWAKANKPFRDMADEMAEHLVFYCKKSKGSYQIIAKQPGDQRDMILSIEPNQSTADNKITALNAVIMKWVL